MGAAGNRRVACHAAEWASTAQSSASAEGRRKAGLRAAWQAWSDCPYDGALPLHSKCVGFALPGEYFAVYLMDRAALSHGDYAYGCDLLVGWPCSDGAFRAYDPSDVAEGRDELQPVYEWRGEYHVERRPWFEHAHRLRLSSASAAPPSTHGQWTPPYSDPVTGERIVSFVSPLQQPEGAVAIAGVFLASGHNE